MEKEEKIWNFYQEMVRLLQKDPISGNKFVEQALTSIIFGYEFQDESLHSIETLERLLLWNLSYNNKSQSNHNYPMVEEFVKPFSSINQDLYFNNLILKDPIQSRKTYMMCKLAEDMETKPNLSIAISLLQKKNPEFIKSYEAISKLKEIIRTGWITRNVEKAYQENDPSHIMQMFSLATAYFRLDETLDLDKEKVYEMILIHEIGELIAGDIAEGSKEHSSKHEKEKEAVIKIFSPIKTGEHFIALWEEFEERKTKESQFVYQLDKIDPVLKAKVLDQDLKREDLFPDFFNYEEKRSTFAKGKVKELFYYIKEDENK